MTGRTITALVTPFYNGEVNYEKLRELLRYQIDAGVSGIVLLGTTGEAPTVTREERRKIIETGVSEAKGKIEVIVGCGSNDTEKAKAQCAEASDIGADAVLVLTPYYNKTNERGMVRHFSEIADESKAPVIIYNVPSRTGCGVGEEALGILSKHENIIGIKEASGNVSFAARIAGLCSDEFFMLCGCDELTLPLMSLGAQGVISVSANVIPREIVRMTAAFAGGNGALALEIHNKFMGFTSALFAEVNPIPIKEAMNILGFEVGGYRLPLCEISSFARERLVKSMRYCGLLGREA